jgi:flagellar motor switch protein FliG
MIPEYDEMHKEFLQILSDEHPQTNALRINYAVLEPLGL